MDQHYLYLVLMGASLLIPLLRSFDRRVAFYKSFGPLFIGIFIVGGLFIIWDMLFTRYGVWGFNEDYLSGIYIGNLPLGEWLFFIVIPYCCVFIYRVMNYFIKKDVLGPHQDKISNFLMAFCATIAIVFHDRLYTVLTFSFLTILIYLHAKLWHTPWLSRFYLSYLVILIPFFIINGILTGTGIEDEIVWYNDMENMGKRIFTIPVEDVFYGMLLVLVVVSIYEWLGRKWGKGYPQKME